MRAKQDEKLAELLSEVKRLAKEVAQLRGEREAALEASTLGGEIRALREEISELEISKAKIEESHARKLREVEHKVGLDRKRSEQEAELAKRTAILEVKEENLGHEREAFGKEMAFMRTRMEAEVGSLQDLMGKILERLPTVTVEKSITLNGD